jgi:hypothetical protein
MFTAIKRTIGNHILRKQCKQLNYKRRFHNFNTAQTIGLIYPYSKTMDQQVGKFIRFFNERKKKVRALGYIAEAEVPQSFITTLNKTVFCKSQLNWYNKPSSHEIDAFIATPFDILIDFSNEPVFPLQYIAALSRAAMRVGRIAYPGNPYEFLLSLPSPSDNHAYIEQLKHYLFTIQIK